MRKPLQMFNPAIIIIISTRVTNRLYRSAIFVAIWFRGTDQSVARPLVGTPSRASSVCRCAADMRMAFASPSSASASLNAADMAPKIRKVSRRQHIWPGRPLRGMGAAYPPKYVRRVLWVLAALLLADVVCNAVLIGEARSKTGLVATSVFARRPPHSPEQFNLKNHMLR